MKTVPLHGKKAAGRVVQVDDGDYDLVMQYRWHVFEEKIPGCRPKGPYAVANSYATGRHTVLRMHCLIMGAKGIDHIDHDGLNNQRSNLRVATGAQNNQNARPRRGGTSQYKGVSRVGRGLWRAHVIMDGQIRFAADLASELEAAYAYDSAARELFGEFACPNFPEGPTEEMRKQWRLQRELRSAAVMAAARQGNIDGVKRWWAQREPEMCICVECGAEFQSRAVGAKMRCSKECREKAHDRARSARRAEQKRRGERVT